MRNKRWLLSDAEAADELGVSVHTIRDWRTRGLLPYLKAGRHPRIRRDDLERFLFENAPVGQRAYPGRTASTADTSPHV